REDLLAALRRSKQLGRKLVLASASDRAIAERIATHLGLFDEVFSSDGQANLRAATKRERLALAYAEDGFDYVRDSRDHLMVCEGAMRAFLVSSTRRAAEIARSRGKIPAVSGRPGLLAALRKELRLHQWAKNALVVVAVVFAPGLPPLGLIGPALTAAFAFSL